LIVNFTMMRKKQQHEQHQQLELDLWQFLAVAQAAPATADMVLLCSHLEGLDLIDGARAIGAVFCGFMVRVVVGGYGVFDRM
jgi:hypothetical protein